MWTSIKIIKNIPNNIKEIDILKLNYQFEVFTKDGLYINNKIIYCKYY